MTSWLLPSIRTLRWVLSVVMSPPACHGLGGVSFPGWGWARVAVMPAGVVAFGDERSAAQRLAALDEIRRQEAATSCDGSGPRQGLVDDSVLE
jgi:hypothetical protein